MPKTKRGACYVCGTTTSSRFRPIKDIDATVCAACWIGKLASVPAIERGAEADRLRRQRISPPAPLRYTGQSYTQVVLGPIHSHVLLCLALMCCRGGDGVPAPPSVALRLMAAAGSTVDAAASAGQLFERGRMLGVVEGRAQVLAEIRAAQQAAAEAAALAAEPVSTADSHINSCGEHLSCILLTPPLPMANSYSCGHANSCRVGANIQVYGMQFATLFDVWAFV